METGYIMTTRKENKEESLGRELMERGGEKFEIDCNKYNVIEYTGDWKNDRKSRMESSRNSIRGWIIDDGELISKWKWMGSENNDGELKIR